MEYHYLFSPLKIGPVTLKNRLAFGPNCPFTGGQRPAGYFDEDSAYFYGERAKGGQGLIVIGNTRLSRKDPFWPTSFSTLYDDGAIEPLRRVADEVHRYGARVFIQLAAMASRTMEMQQNNLYGDPEAELASRAASQLPYFGVPGVTPREMTVADIQEMIEDFGRGARRAMDAGLDGVEVLAWSENPHWMFLSPFFNKRKDGYGGSVENRARVLIETLGRIRECVSDRIAVGYRISADSLCPGDLGLDEVKDIVRHVNASVKVDFVSMALGGYHSFPYDVAFMGSADPGFQLPFAAEIKSVVDVPVFAGGSISAPQMAEEALANGQCDVVLMVRQMFADPEWANKVTAGREEDIRPCVRYNYCHSRTSKGLRAECVYNPASGRENIWGIGSMHQAASRRKVLVIGGGPGGLEAARVSAERGHDVVVYEKEPEVGGRVRLQARLPRMAEIGSMASWLERQAVKAGARIVTGREITPENLDAILASEGPDVAIVATGSVSARDGLNSLTGTTIPGWQQDNVYVYEDVVEGRVGPVGKALVLDDVSDERVPGLVAMLAVRAEQVQLITRLARIGEAPHIDLSALGGMLRLMYQRRNFKMVPFSFVRGIEGGCVRVVFLPTGEERVEEDVDAVVLMTMFKSNNELYPLLQDKVGEVHVIGDARAPRTIHEAVLEGHRLARKL